MKNLIKLIALVSVMFVSTSCYVGYSDGNSSFNISTPYYYNYGYRPYYRPYSGPFGPYPTMVRPRYVYP